MKPLIFIGLIMCICGPAAASELTGTITTDPRDVAGQGSGTVTPTGPSADPAGGPTPAANGASAAILRDRTRTADPLSDPNVRVLGVERLPDGLWRGSLHRVYAVRSGYKRIVRNPAQLRRYAGQPIAEAADADLSLCPDRAFLDGDLIRARGTARIYVIEAGKRRPVLTLDELRRTHRGKPIAAVTPEEIENLP